MRDFFYHFITIANMILFITELQKFLKQNWWIFILLIIALTIIYLTWKWNILEVSLLFFANFIWNLFIMLMQSNYTNKNNKLWAIYQVSSVIIFSIIWLYWLFILSQFQYILWQISYLCAAIKTFSYYNLWKNISFLNEKSFFILNSILLIIFLYFFKFQNFAILQVLWFSLITSWLVSTIDNIRYWFNLIWIWLLTSGSA